LGGGTKVPSKTALNALLQTPISPKISSKGDVKKGVSLAWVNLLPTSARQALSRSGLDVHSQSLSDPTTRTFTIAKGQWDITLPNANLTWQAVSLTCLQLKSCFQAEGGFLTTSSLSLCLNQLFNPGVLTVRIVFEMVVMPICFLQFQLQGFHWELHCIHCVYHTPFFGPATKHQRTNSVSNGW